MLPNGRKPKITEAMNMEIMETKLINEGLNNT
jgi:hypothetical protein